MYKVLLRIIVPLLLLISPVSLYAQSFFGFGQQKNESTVTGQGSSNRILSPDEFKSSVNTLSQQSSDQLKQQLNQEIAQRPVVGSKTPEIPPASQTNSGAMTTPPPPPTTTVPPVSQTPGPTVAAPTAPIGPPTTGGPTTTQPMPAQPMPTQPQPPQGNVYTGFGPGNNTTTNPSNTSSGNQGGGWNIKY